MKWPVFAVALLIAVAAPSGCGRSRRVEPAPPPAPPIQLLTQYGKGDDMRRVYADWHLAEHEVRLRAGLPDGETSAVYFLDQGNLHLEAKRNENGDMILRNTPFIEPAADSIKARLQVWDQGAQTQHYQPERKRR